MRDTAEKCLKVLLSGSCLLCLCLESPRLAGPKQVTLGLVSQRLDLYGLGRDSLIARPRAFNKQFRLNSQRPLASRYRPELCGRVARFSLGATPYLLARREHLGPPRPAPHKHSLSF